MALSQSALSELLEAFRPGEGVNPIRDASQGLIKLEASGAIGAEHYEGSAQGRQNMSVGMTLIELGLVWLVV